MFHSLICSVKVSVVLVALVVPVRGEVRQKGRVGRVRVMEGGGGGLVFLVLFAGRALLGRR